MEAPATPVSSRRPHAVTSMFSFAIMQSEIWPCAAVSDIEVTSRGGQRERERERDGNGDVVVAFTFTLCSQTDAWSTRTCDDLLATMKIAARMKFNNELIATWFTAMSLIVAYKQSKYFWPRLVYFSSEKCRTTGLYQAVKDLRRYVYNDNNIRQCGLQQLRVVSTSANKTKCNSGTD